MSYLHQELQLGINDVVEVVLDNPANVQFLDPHNYEAYRTGRPFRYHGGHVKEKVYRFEPPRPGTWHLVWIWAEESARSGPWRESSAARGKQ